jgi:DNA-binding NtrC family response regulator
MTQEAIDALTGYDWPGNVRQLRNEIERVIAYAYEGARISCEDLSPEVIHPRRPAGERFRPAGERRFGLPSDGRYLAEQNGNRIKKPSNGETRIKLREATAILERQLIEESLAINKNNLTRTASDLGLSRRGLRLKLAQLGIHREDRL